MPPNTVKVDRTTKWGNQAAKIGEDISYYTMDCTSATASDVVDLFRRFMDAYKAADPAKHESFIAPLRGKNLACWCKIGSQCHADVLLKIANQVQP